MFKSIYAKNISISKIYDIINKILSIILPGLTLITKLNFNINYLF